MIILLKSINSFRDFIIIFFNYLIFQKCVDKTKANFYICKFTIKQSMAKKLRFGNLRLIINSIISIRSKEKCSNSNFLYFLRQK